MCASQVILPAFQKLVDGACTQRFGTILNLLRQQHTPAELQHSQVQVMNKVACDRFSDCGRWVVDACSCRNVGLTHGK